MLHVSCCTFVLLPNSRSLANRVARFDLKSLRIRGDSNLGPDIMQSGFGVNFYFGPANFRKIAGEFWWRILMANFDSEFFGLVFPGFQATQKITPKIHVQNCGHSSPISLSWTLNLFTAIFCLQGRPTNRCKPRADSRHLRSEIITPHSAKPKGVPKRME